MALRDQVFAELDGMCCPGEKLDPAACRLPGVDAAGRASFDRARARIDRADQYLERQQSIPRQGLAALITAGPPGAGKTAHIRDTYPESDWRIVDADIVKDLVLTHEIPDGTFAHLLATRLADGHPIKPRELAGLVHRESIIITNIIRGRCLADGENIVIEGTLAWPPHGPQLLRELAAAGYERVNIVSVDIPHGDASSRTKQRWWSGRQSAIGGGDPFGGRFVPTAVVDNAYDDRDENMCAANARTTFNDPAAQSFAHVQLTTSSDDRADTVIKGAPDA